MKRPSIDSPDFNIWIWWQIWPVAFGLACSLAVIAPKGYKCT